MHLSWCLAACSKTGNSLPTPEERVKEILSGKVTGEAMEMGWLDHEMMAWLEKNATFAGGDGDGTVNQVEDVTDLFKQTKITISDPAKIPSKEIDSYFSIMEMPDLESIRSEMQKEGIKYNNESVWHHNPHIHIHSNHRHRSYSS